MQCINLSKEAVKILGMRGLTIEGKTVIFKPLGISKTLHLALIKIVSVFTVEQLNTIKKTLFGKEKIKVKHSTLCNSQENGGQKDVDIFYKIIVSSVPGREDYVTIISMIGK